MALLTYRGEIEAYADALERFSDGLPIVLPTQDRVAAMLAATTRPLDTQLGAVLPAGTMATVRDVAVNAVLAGLPPSAFEIVLAAVEAAVEPAFNLNGLQATTHSAGIMTLVSGPGAQVAGMNAASNALGQGNRSNATIGRALRLVMTNLGDGRPGSTDMSVQGSPVKYGFAFAERIDAANPWPSLAQRAGDANGTIVTLMAAEAPHLVCDHRSNSASRLLDNIADVMRTIGSLNACIPGHMALIVCPQHAAILANDGFGPAEVQAALFERARNSLERLRGAGEFDAVRTPGHLGRYGSVDDPRTRMPVIASPEHLILAVAGGGSGGFSSVVPSWLASIPATRPIHTLSLTGEAR